MDQRISLWKQQTDCLNPLRLAWIQTLSLSGCSRSDPKVMQESHLLPRKFSSNRSPQSQGIRACGVHILCKGRQ